MCNLESKTSWIWQTLTSKITEFKSPYYFVDEMVKGAFKNFRHEHHFSKIENGTLMTDVFIYKAPYGIIGTFIEYLFLTEYMLKFLYKRNQIIKLYAESKNREYFLEINSN